MPSNSTPTASLVLTGFRQTVEAPIQPFPELLEARFPIVYVGDGAEVEFNLQALIKIPLS